MNSLPAVSALLRRSLLLVSLCGVSMASASVPVNEADRGPVTVLASIYPLSLIAQAVLAPDDHLQTLLPRQGSPHDYALKVSDMRRLRGADLVLWTGPELERFLSKPLARRPQALAILELGDLHWPDLHRPDKHGEHVEDEYAASAGSHEHHSHAGRDPHVWLNPHNAMVVAEALVDRLSQLRPEQAPAYRTRLRQVKQRWQDLDRQLSAQLSPLQGAGFAVYHRGYDHWVARYSLRQLSAVTVSPERRPGARHLYQLRQRLVDARCLFTEPYYDMRLAEDLAAELNLRLALLDPLASRGVSSYEQLLSGLADGMSSCLGDA